MVAQRRLAHHDITRPQRMLDQPLGNHSCRGIVTGARFAQIRNSSGALRPGAKGAGQGSDTNLPD